ncbi:MAG: hypothetical protein LBC42_03785 [Puniceicoccales bacterium]|jgi:hypothetical protein|nr:hypothetical protein [Puniceicoccales bacterium]
MGGAAGYGIDSLTVVWSREYTHVSDEGNVTFRDSARYELFRQIVDGNPVEMRDLLRRIGDLPFPVDEFIEQIVGRNREALGLIVWPKLSIHFRTKKLPMHWDAQVVTTWNWKIFMISKISFNRLADFPWPVR